MPVGVPDSIADLRDSLYRGLRFVRFPEIVRSERVPVAAQVVASKPVRGPPVRNLREV